MCSRPPIRLLRGAIQPTGERLSAWPGRCAGARQASGAQSGLVAGLSFPARQRATPQSRTFLCERRERRANLAAENPGWDFDAVRACRARHLEHAPEPRPGLRRRGRRPAHLLHRALPRAAPAEHLQRRQRAVSRLRPVHTATGHTQYANFSGWDIYRTQIPLDRVDRAEAGERHDAIAGGGRAEGGGLPRWSLANIDTGLMVGDPAAAILAEGLAFGADGFDTDAALNALVRGATQPGVGAPGLRSGPASSSTCAWATSRWAPPSARPPRHRSNTIPPIMPSLASPRTWATPRRRKLSPPGRRSGHALFDPATGYIQPRTDDGAFVGNGATTDGSIEGTASQYTWMIPFDIGGLVTRWVDARMPSSAWMRISRTSMPGRARPQAWMGNEVSFGAPWALRLRWRALENAGDRPPGHGRAVQEFAQGPAGQRRPGHDVVVVCLGRARTVSADSRARWLCAGQPALPTGDAHPGRPPCPSSRMAPTRRPRTSSRCSSMARPIAAMAAAIYAHQRQCLDLYDDSTPNRAWGSAPVDAPPSLSMKDWKNSPPNDGNVEVRDCRRGNGSCRS